MDNQIFLCFNRLCSIAHIILGFFKNKNSFYVFVSVNSYTYKYLSYTLKIIFSMLKRMIKEKLSALKQWASFKKLRSYFIISMILLKICIYLIPCTISILFHLVTYMFHSQTHIVIAPSPHPSFFPLSLVFSRPDLPLSVLYP